MTDDFINLNNENKNDRVIRKLYTPKEVVKIIKDMFEVEISRSDLTYSEKLLIWNCYNDLIWCFKDD